MKIKEVKTTITETMGEAMVFDTENNTVATMNFRLQQSFKTEDGVEKGVRDYLKTLGCALVKINHYSRVKVTYAVPIEIFMENAYEVERVSGLSPLD